jgi:hypothetical protein
MLVDACWCLSLLVDICRCWFVGLFGPRVKETSINVFLGEDSKPPHVGVSEPQEEVPK